MAKGLATYTEVLDNFARPLDARLRVSPGAAPGLVPPTGHARGVRERSPKSSPRITTA